MKKLLSIILTVIMIFCLVACGTAKENQTNEESSNQSSIVNNEQNKEIQQNPDTNINENKTDAIDETESEEITDGEASEEVPGLDKTPEITEEDLLLTIVDYVAEDSGIIESRADSTMSWHILKTSNDNEYEVYYGNDEIAFYNARCTYNPDTDELSWVVVLDDKQNYNPDTNYSKDIKMDVNWNETFIQTEYSGQTAKVLKAVKDHCKWYEPWLKKSFPKGLTKGNGCDWLISQIDDTNWIGCLVVFDSEGSEICYECTCSWDGNVFVVTDDDGPYI